MGKTRKNNGERKLIFGAVILLIISAILFGLATDQGMNLIKNIQDRVMLNDNNCNCIPLCRLPDSSSGKESNYRCHDQNSQIQHTHQPAGRFQLILQ